MSLRAFIALELPVAIQDAITDRTAKLRTTLARPLVRWVPLHNVHLTLKFLGEVSPANLGNLAQVLKVEAREHAPFTFSVGGLGVFPNPRRPRVIWIGLETPPALVALARGIETICVRLGYDPENRPFSPHLTIGRVNQNTSAAELQHVRFALERTQVGAFGAVTVDAVHIFKSELLPGGTIYSHLYSAPLESGDERK